MLEFAKYIPLAVVGISFGLLLIILKRDQMRTDRYWDEEAERQQRVKDLYPEPPSYEERMGVQYGPDQDE